MSREYSGADLAAWSDMTRRHLYRIGRTASDPMENDEPCVCHTDFTCMADEHEEQER